MGANDAPDVRRMTAEMQRDRRPPRTIESGVVDVWPVWLRAEEAAPAAFAILSEDEAMRAQHFARVSDRAAFVVARAALRILAGAYLGEAPGDVEFAYAERGKPQLAGSSSLRFNVSHCAGLAVFAFAIGLDLGVDVEPLRPVADRDAIAERFFCTGEREDLASLREGDRDLAFLRCWTRKEAFVKATGDGLLRPLDAYCVTLLPHDPPALRRIGADDCEARAWTMHDVALGPDFIGALAYRGERRTIRQREPRLPADLFAR